MKSTDQEECVLCCRDITIYATGICDHAVCFECSTRMRVLCETKECPICRSDMPVVIFTHLPQQFSEIANKFSLYDKKYHVVFEDNTIQKAFETLLEHRCKSCKELFPSFEKLKDHVRRKHDLQYCDLCADNLKIFTFERKCYSRKDLARHRRVGDPDETSHRGHPICEFCDQRYVDLDDLFRHLRREHFFCHFCDADGKHQYYNDYDHLRVHFRKEHYLCEEGDCVNEKFTAAFRTEIDLKVHITSHHNKNKSKAEARQARMLEFEFTYAHHNRPAGNSSPRGGRFNQYKKRNTEENNSRESRSNPETETESFDMQSTQEFPYLSEDAVKRTNISNHITNSNLNSLTVQSYGRNPAPQRRRNVMSTEDFPALCSTTVAVTSEMSSNQSRKINFSINRQNNAPIRTSNVSIQLSQKNAPSQNMRTFEEKKLHLNSDSSDSAAGKGKPQTGTWVKKEITNFEEEFPKLEVKKMPADLPVSNNFSSTLVRNNMPSFKPDTVPESHVNNTDQFVIIKGKSKKKKQNKSFAEKPENDFSDSSTKLYLLQNNLFNDQENEDPFKKSLTTTAGPQPPNLLDEKFSEVTFGKNDFPPLASSEPVRKPPGYNAVKKQAPPPGFSAKSNLSTVPLNISLSSVAKQIVLPNENEPNGILEAQTDYASIHKICKTGNSNTFTKPPDFEKRNEKLKEKIQEILNTQDLFLEFKTLSGRFRQNVISAAEYHTKCLRILGEKGFLEIFPLLVSLLPDINKQQELLTVHDSFFKCQRYGGAVPKQIMSTNNQIFVCDQCQQVLMKSDCKSHNLFHETKLSE